jgi:hypothetical protein
VSAATLLRIMAGEQEPTGETLSLIARWLDRPLPEMRPSVHAHLRAEKNLHPDVAGALVRLFRAIEQGQWSPSTPPIRFPPQSSSFYASPYPLTGYVRQVENLARSIRRIWGPSDPDLPFEPFALAHGLGIQTLTPEGVPGLSEYDRRLLLDVYPDRWSGGTVCLADGLRVVVLNSKHEETRTRATLMEEICHVLFGHEPTALREYRALGQAFRDYDKEQEKEAYWVGAAVLLPHEPLARAVRAGVEVAVIAQRYRVSEALVKFRIKVTGLWSFLVNPQRRSDPVEANARAPGSG